MTLRHRRLAGLLGIVAATLVASLAYGQHSHHAGQAATSDTPGSRRVTMQELHEMGGVPQGWKFTLPGGDAARGREVFANLECYKCHAIKGESFPAAGGDAKNVGPELTGMGGHHPAEYFAESILSPNAVILTGPGYTGPDGRSIMPSFADSISVTQLVDLVAYLKSLTGGNEHDRHAGNSREGLAGPYRVRLVYMMSGDHDHAQGGHAHHAMGAGSGHLMAFITDRESNEPLPYLPVTATIQIAGKPVRTVRLAPMLGGRGFHYGTDVVLPEDTRRITLAIGGTTMAVMGASGERYKMPTTAAFDWEAAPK